MPATWSRQYTDAVATSQNIPGFDPTEISVDSRTNGATCHTLVYVMSPTSGQFVVVNTRNCIPVAIINTPEPGGLSNQTGGGQAANVVLVTNSSANTLTIFDITNITPGHDLHQRADLHPERHAHRQHAAGGRDLALAHRLLEPRPWLGRARRSR